MKFFNSNLSSLLFYNVDSLLQLLLPCLPLGLLALGVGQPGPALRQHLHLILVYVLGVRVNLARLQFPWVADPGLPILLPLGHVKQVFIPLPP